MEKNTVSPSGSDTSVASGTILGKRKFTTTDLPEYSWPEESHLKNIRRNTHEFASIQRKRDAYAMRYQFPADKFHHNDTKETRLTGNSDSQRYEIEYSKDMPLSNELQFLKHEEQFRKLEVQTRETPKLPSWILEKGNVYAQSGSKGSLSIPSYTSYTEKSQSEPVVQNTALKKTLLATFCNDDLSVTRRAMGTFQQSSSQPDRSNILSDRRASMHEVNEFDTSCPFGQRGQVFQKIESNNAPKSCAEQKDIRTKGKSNVGDSEGFNKENKNSSLVEEFASRYDQNSDKSFKHEKQKLNHGSHRFEEKSMSKLHKSSVAAGKIWVGSLQLNSSIAVPAVSFFKSGEKLLDVNWYELVDVKGKVRLDAFEKYIEELSRSRNRGLMVISVSCNKGSETDIKHMKEVAKGYVKGERVGLARLSQGSDLYLCPRTDTIITILAKHGFFKGLAAIQSTCELFIGCVVWRKNHSVAKKSESNTNSSQSEQLQKSLPDSVDAQAVSKSSISSVGDAQALASAKSSLVAESNDIKDNQNTGGVDNSSSNAISLPTLSLAEQRGPVPSKSESQVTPGKVCYTEPARGNVEVPKYSLALPSNTSSQKAQVTVSLPMLSLAEKRGPVPSKSDSQVTPGKVCYTEPARGNVELPKYSLALPSNTSSQKAQKKPFNDDDLPEFDFGSAGGVSKSCDGKSSDAHLLNRTRTEDGSGNLTGYLAHSVPVSKPTASNSTPNIDTPPNREASVHGAPLPLSRRMEGRHAHQSPIPPPKIAIPKIPFADLGKKIFFDDDDDMPEWLPPDLKKQSFAKRSDITTTNPGFKNFPFNHHPPRPSPPPPNPPMFSSLAGPPLLLRPPFNSNVPPPVPSRDGQSYMTGFTFNPVLQPPSGPLAGRSPLQPAGGVWRP
nr:uncharacterized protein LOC109178781 [Ipomoea batatas]GME14379.1 uncharacterized protein LOC109178781 [Ipomoea batatas]